VRDVASGMDLSAIKGISYRNSEGVIVHNQDRAMLENMDELPFVSEVYKRDLQYESTSSAT